MLEWLRRKRGEMEQHGSSIADQAAADRDWQVHNPRVSSEQLEALRQQEKLVARRLRRQQQKDLAA